MYVHKKGLLILKLSLGQRRRDCHESWAESGEWWVTSPGSTRKVSESCYLGNPTPSRVLKNNQLFPALFRCP